LELFVYECEQLIRAGLVKKYRFQEKNCKALKGKLIFSKNIQHNLVHQENFYTRHQVFDQDHLINQILLKALQLVGAISKSPLLKDRVQSLLLNFPELSDLKVTKATFDRISLNRKTDSYREALEIAAMLLLNYRPDISGGSNNVLAILFDMNDLWEEYIFRQLSKYRNKAWSVRPQTQKRFWHADNDRSFKLVKPDIVVLNQENDSIIVDTKWKLPESNNPADSDLKQMFVYNEFWDSGSALLLYPAATYSKLIEFKSGSFKKGKDHLHRCGMLKISVLDESNKKLDRDLGERLSNFIEEEFKRCLKLFPIN
jgi:5-methylcytosine-specific restriction enzyme subunit McrC